MFGAADAARVCVARQDVVGPSFVLDFVRNQVGTFVALSGPTTQTEEHTVTRSPYGFWTLILANLLGACSADVDDSAPSEFDDVAVDSDDVGEPAEEATTSEAELLHAEKVATTVPFASFMGRDLPSGTEFTLCRTLTFENNGTPGWTLGAIGHFATELPGGVTVYRTDLAPSEASDEAFDCAHGMDSLVEVLYSSNEPRSFMETDATDTYFIATDDVLVVQYAAYNDTVMTQPAHMLLHLESVQEN